MIRSIEEELQGAVRIGITGHVRPDGDCVGSVLGLYNYITAYYPETEVTVYLEKFEEHFQFIKGADRVLHEDDRKTQPFDLFFVLDCGALDRTANFVRNMIRTAKQIICIDHHIGEPTFAHKSHVMPKVSSACEVLYELLDPGKMTKEIAEALYTGMVHDTGVFKYQSVTSRTMEIAGRLMETGIDFTAIIDDTFFRKSYAQNLLMGKALLSSRLYLDGKIIYAHMPRSVRKEYGVTTAEMGGIIDQLRFTRGVEVAVFSYELDDGGIKVSLRSVDRVDVNEIAVSFGGGGHIRAAGCTVRTEPETLIEKIVELVKKQV